MSIRRSPTSARMSPRPSISLRRGIALPGPDAREDWNDFALALPAAPAVYFQSKQAALGRAFGDFARIWSVR